MPEGVTGGNGHSQIRVESVTLQPLGRADGRGRLRGADAARPGAVRPVTRHPIRRPSGFRASLTEIPWSTIRIWSGLKHAGEQHRCQARIDVSARSKAAVIDPLANPAHCEDAIADLDDAVAVPLLPGAGEDPTARLGVDLAPCGEAVVEKILEGFQGGGVRRGEGIGTHATGRARGAAGRADRMG